MNPQPLKGLKLRSGLRAETQQHSRLKICFFIIADIDDLVRTYMTFFFFQKIITDQPINLICDTVITMATSVRTIENLVDSESCKHFDLINHACLH